MGNLNLPQIAANQAQKHQTSNDADDYLDLALTETLTVDLTSADATLTDAEFREAFTFVCSGHTVARELTVPAIARPFGVVNEGTGTLSVTAGSSSPTATITVAAGEAAIFHADGANGLLRIGQSASPSVLSYPYDVGAGYPGSPSSSEVIMRYPFPRDVTFPSGLTDSRCVCATAATASATFSIQKNGVEVGTMVFGTSSPNTLGEFTMGSNTTFAAGDVLTVVAPSSPDATLAGIGFSLAGTRA